MTTLADRRFEMTLRNRVLVGVGEVARLPDLVAAAGGSRAFIVSDPGVVAAGVVEPALAALSMAGVPSTVFAEVEPNPAAETCERGATALRSFGPGWHGRRRHRWRLGDGRGQGDRPGRHERAPGLGPGVRRR